MQTPERPFDGEVPDDGPPSYEWLDEWLCEYVDGTMDPSVEAVFEQYVEANPELKAHVERLRQTRELLCGCDVPDDAVADAKPDVSREVEEDLLQSSPALSESFRKHPTAALSIVSSIAVALVVGFLAGSMLVHPATLSSTPTVSAVDEPSTPQQPVQADAPFRSRGAPSSPSSQVSSFAANGSLGLRPASRPPSGTDTVRTPSALTMGKR